MYPNAGIRCFSLYMVYTVAVLETGIGYVRSSPILSLFRHTPDTPTANMPIFVPGKVSQAQTHRPDTTEATITIENAKDVKMLADKMWDLNQCPPGIQVLMGSRLITQKSYYCTKHDAVKLATMLNGESISERAYVWCRTAFLYNSLKNDMKTFDVEELNRFEGDIVLSRENVDFILGSYLPTPMLREASIGAAYDYIQKNPRRRQKRKIGNANGVWNNAKVEFSISDNSFDSADKRVITEAISQWESQTCIRFIEKERRFVHHLEFKRGEGCTAHIGRLVRGVNTITLGSGCVTVGIVAHEIGHTLGFYHEQARPDRDNYVTVAEENIIPERKLEFTKASWRDSLTYDVPYDYSSIMHYNGLTFSSNTKFTLRTNDEEMQMVIGQRKELSFLDVKLANIYYCKSTCRSFTLEWDRCKHEGYRNPNSCDTCLCPQGLAPPYCEAPLQGVNVQCGKQILLASSYHRTLESPGYNGEGFPENALCSYLIKATGPGRQIKVKFSDKFGFSDDPDLCYDYVEVRYKQLYRAGPRFCGHNIPGKELISHGQEMLVLIHTELPIGWQGFRLKYYEEQCGGCSPDHGLDEPPCNKMVKYNCAPSGHITYCYRPEQYCCAGLTMLDNKCVVHGGVKDKVRTGLAKATTEKPTTTARPLPSTRKTTTRRPFTPPSSTTQRSIFRVYTPPNVSQFSAFKDWSRWSAWSACSATCGLCGRKHRSRSCLGIYCFGPMSQEEICGASLCPFQTLRRSKTCRKLRDNSCPWYDFTCYRTYTCYEVTTKPRCCVGTPSLGAVCRR